MELKSNSDKVLSDLENLYNELLRSGVYNEYLNSLHFAKSFIDANKDDVEEILEDREEV